MHTLPNLPYGYNALEPYIDEETMRLHHTKHHQGYVDKLNGALADYNELQAKAVEELIKDLNELPEDIRLAVRNNGGGHFNHSLFWQVMSPAGGGEPVGQLAEQLNKNFGSFSQFKEIFTQTALNRFGSGWAWLVFSDDELRVVSTANQDSPLMGEEIAGCSGLPILGVDVWEHAYYLKYQNRRADYLKNWWSLVNWQEVAKRLTAALA